MVGCWKCWVVKVCRCVFSRVVNCGSVYSMFGVVRECSWVKGL